MVLFFFQEPNIVPVNTTHLDLPLTIPKLSFLLFFNAGLPIHWVYNQDDLNAIVAKHDKPEFIPEGHCPFYKLPTGSLSGFADQGYALLQSLVESKGKEQIIVSIS